MDPPLESSSRAREREFNKYYEPFKAAIAGNRSNLERPNGRPRSSDDPALTAFAQLGALRLGVRRCAISLFDHRVQYVLAEATKTLSLQTDEAEIPQDALLWGVAEFPLETGLCQHTIAVPLEFLELEDGHRTEIGVSIFPDMSKDPRFSRLPFVCGGDTRFYAGVPIRAPSGLALGSYCIMDDTPRQGLTSSEVAFLKDMATTVMVHLEMVRAREQTRRNAIFVHGLASFVEGESSIWGGRRAATETAVSVSGMPKWYDEQYAMQRVASPFSRRTMSTSSASTEHSASGTPGSAPSIAEDQDSGLASPQSEAPILARNTQNVPHRMSKYVGRHVVPSSTNKKKKQSSSLDVRQTFARAASIICECVDVDGVVLYDASISTFGGMVDSGSDVERSRTATIQSHATNVDKSDASSDSALREGTDDGHGESACGVLGFATPTCSSLNGDKPPEAQQKMTERLLRRLMRRYRFGHVFDFDETGMSPPAAPVSPRQPSGRGTRDKHHSSKGLHRSEEAVLRELFPGVRSMVIIPLYDVNRRCNYAGGVIWTTDAQRVFSKEQALTYLAAFADSIMADVARIEAKIGERTKSDFISSISHELRSPLHGILGSVECLQELETHGLQKELLHTVETCGKTLLDTIDHLLEFTKINNMSRTSGNHGHISAKPSSVTTHEIGEASRDSKMKRQQRELETKVDLAVTTQEVMETVLAGHAYLTGSVSGRRTDGFVRNTKGTESTHRNHSVNTYAFRSDDKELTVGLDIDRTIGSRWLFRMQAGAWRRIVMNLLGNSIKYTSKGEVQLALKSTPLSSSGKGSCSEVILTVSDTGLGMSEEFQRNKLFTPFAQEDYLAPGTGLGLSIIKQIITDMGGTISVRSQQGQGTVVKVRMVLFHTPPVLSAKLPSTRQPNGPNSVAGTVDKAPALADMPQIVSRPDRTANRGQSLTDIDDIKKLESNDNNANDNNANATDTGDIPSAAIIPSSNAAHPAANNSPRRPEGRTKNVLLVDDNHINLKLLEMYSTKQGHRYRTATNGLEALETFQSVTSKTAKLEKDDKTKASKTSELTNSGNEDLDHFDYILMDISMPVMDGLESTRRIRAHERGLAASKQTEGTQG